MATTEKVIFAEDAATVHIISGDVEELPDGTKYEPHESRVLKPGETLQLSEVPSYLREAVKEGKAPGLVLLTPAQAKKILKQADLARAVGILESEEDEE